MARDESSTFAFLPAVALGGWRCLFELAIVTPIADACALGTAAQGLGETASATLEDLLVDVRCAGPREAASVVATSDE